MRIPFVRQRITGDGDEMATGSLELVLDDLLKAFGAERRSVEIFEAMPADQKTFELVDLLNVMDAIGYVSSKINGRACDIDDRLLPCLFVSKGGGCKVMVCADASKEEGAAFVFRKRDAEEDAEQRKQEFAAGIGWIEDAVFRFKKLFCKIVLLSFALNVAALTFPFFILAIYNWIAGSVGFTTIISLIIGAVIAVLIEINLRVIRSRQLAWFATRMDYITGSRTFSHLLALPSFAIEKASIGSQIARLKSFEVARDFFTGSLFLTLLDVPFTILYVISLFFVGGAVGFVPIVAIATSILIMYHMHPRLNLAMLVSARKRGLAHGAYIESFEKCDALRQNGMSEVWSEKVRDYSAGSSISGYKVSLLGQVQETISYAIAMFGAIALVYIGANSTIAGGMSSGALFASLVFYWRIMGPWQAFYGNIPRLKQTINSISQMDKLFAIDTESQASVKRIKPALLGQTLAFSNVGLRYSKNSDPVCVGLSFDVPRGTFVTIAGGNGAGKTTILKLALGLYRPQAGSIRMDGQDIRQIDPSYLRKMVSYVPQMPELFDATVGDNVRYGNPLATDQQIWRALELADAASMVGSLPLKLDTNVGLVGGSNRLAFEYKIALARAFVKDASLFLIDEIPSQVLAGEVEKNLFELLKAWRGHKTVLMVSHSDSHLLACDKTVGLLSDRRFIYDVPEKVIKAVRDDALQAKRRFA